MTDQAQMEEEIVGFRFHPTGYELVNHHLKRKLQKIDENRCVIPDVNVYDYNPPDLHTVYNGRLNPNSNRYKRQARGGYWSETGEKKDIVEEETGKTIGTKRILVFYSGKQGNAHATEWAMHEYHLNADAADSTITDPMAIAICQVKRKARNKKGNLKKQQSKKGNSKKQQSKNGNSKKQQSTKAGSPSYEADSSSHGIETRETNFQEFSLLVGEENIPAQPEKGSPPSVGVYSPMQFLMAERSAIVNHGFDNEDFKKAGTPSYETNSISPSIEAQETNFQEFSLLMEELNIPTQPEKGSLEPLLMAEQSVIVNHGFDDEHGYTCSLTYEQSNSIMQMENFGSKEASPESNFLGQPAVESQTPQTKSPIVEGPEYTAGGTCYKESYAAFSNDYENGIWISDLDFWRDDELVQKQIHGVLY
ncbi:hypothetical protein CDL15_Pgr028463 [Punica granatum]|uniref:NAC domain-containing protein n=1 Tax=Punica granatum TaxID=22663 RepID=A0A218VWG5_PUNGR|nr:hypothetical protein CDL15_Pgr028463 [Punica granatum]